VPYYDLPEEQLRDYAPDLDEPSDLDAFWARTLEESRKLAVPPNFEPVATGLALVETADVTYSGFGGEPVRAWLHMPRGAREGLPAVVRYQGYGGGRGLAHEVGLWALAGFASLVTDTRGQGSAWSPGDTPDPAGSGPAHPGFMTRGIGDPATYYYRRVFTDAAMAIDAVRSHPLVDAKRVAVTGASQGGGVSLAVAALVPDLAAVMADVPFLCDFRRATWVAPSDPYGEIVRYLKVHRDQVQRIFSTLAYFDCATLAKRATAPALFSVSLMDQICPPSTVYAAYNHYAGPKEMVEYQFNDHEGGLGFQEAVQLKWLRSLFGSGLG
jgi:cephalosporin-C deacetylase